MNAGKIANFSFRPFSVGERHIWSDCRNVQQLAGQSGMRIATGFQEPGSIGFRVIAAHVGR